MKILKGLALGLLSFLLFLSLSLFGVLLMLNLTILNPHFVVSELNRLDTSTIAEEFLSQQSGEGIFQDEPYIAEVVEKTITDLEPWIREQTGAAIYAGYDYLLGKSQNLSLEIPLEPLRDSLKDNLRDAVLQSPPPELAGLPPAAKEQYINEAYQNIDELIPPRFEANESLLDPEVLTQLGQARQYIGYLQTSYWVLMGFIPLLILGIIFLNRQVKGATRELGIIFLTYGVIEYVSIFIAKNLAGGQLSTLDVPQTIQTWLPQLLDGILAPLEIFSICFIVAGIALITVSFVYKPRQPSPELSGDTGNDTIGKPQTS
jgi:hypothetical protein